MSHEAAGLSTMDDSRADVRAPAKLTRPFSATREAIFKLSQVVGQQYSDPANNGSLTARHHRKRPSNDLDLSAESRLGLGSLTRWVNPTMKPILDCSTS